MQTESLQQFLDDFPTAVPWLKCCHLTDLPHAHQNLLSIAQSGVPLDLLASLCRQLETYLPGLSDPDRALNNVDRFFAAARSPLSLAALFERDHQALPILLQIFATSQYLSDILITDAESYNTVRLTEGQPIPRSTLVEELVAEVQAFAGDEAAVMAALRRFKRRETLRVGYGDIVRSHRIEVVTAQISYIAEAILEAAVQGAMSLVDARRGLPIAVDGERARFSVLALGKLGGRELNYSSDIDLIFLYDFDGQTSGSRGVSNREYFERVSQKLLRLLGEPTELGIAYRVDMRLRPNGNSGPIVNSLDQSLHYYDSLGRTWERQAFVKARAVAGDLALGNQLLKALEPWIYRRWLNRADISGIKALKRRIERRTQSQGGEQRDVKTGHGGIRDIEFVIQFLQLLNGGDRLEVRTSNTLEAIAELENCGCLTLQERSLLEENYAFLRKIEHRLQMMFDLQTHLMPDDAAEMRKLALRMGYRPAEGSLSAETPHSLANPEAALTAFVDDYRRRTEINRKILDHLLHDAFRDEQELAPEVDLVLDPDPPLEQIEALLSKYGFRNVEAAYQNLMALSVETVRFLSTRRCRHFLASIAPRLLEAIAQTTDPDATLMQLSVVSDSLGGKGVLWELFSFNPSVLRLYVELCASSPLLSNILISHPGMIDELMDSLLLDQLPSFDWLQANLADLLHQAEDVWPIIHSFKVAHFLRVGVRDILGKEPLQATMGALSDIAQVCLDQVVQHEYQKLVTKFGEPMIGTGERAGEVSRFALLGLGKFGGRELNYQSDLDLIFLYEADGQTFHHRKSRQSSESTSNQHFFSELGQRIIKAVNHLGPYGRLYEIDARLRPTGKSGTLAISLNEFVRYFVEGSGQLWERQSLCRARVVFGSELMAQETMQRVRQAIFASDWQPENAAEIAHMRQRLEASVSSNNLKRGRGGIVDIEFIVQLLQLRHGRKQQEILVSNVLDALERFEAAKILSQADARQLASNYRTLRTMEARICLMEGVPRDQLPQDQGELEKLARLLGYENASALMQVFQQVTESNRTYFEQACAGTLAVGQ